MSQTILITGAMGYLGGRIAQYLAEHSDDDLRLASRRPRAVRPVWLSRGNFVSLNLEDRASCEAACQGVDVVIHLAALNEMECAADPVAAALVNGAGTWRLVQTALYQKVRKFIFFSTAHVYGAPLTGVITEKTLPRPAHPYASSHHFGEEAVLEAHDKEHMTGIVLRLSNGVGAPVSRDVNRWTLLANDLCRQAVVDRKLTLRSSGLALRDFIPVSDICLGVRHCLEMPRSSCGDGVFNLGAGVSMSVLDMAELIAGRCEKVLGFRPSIQRPDPVIGERALNLDYCVDKFRETGFLPAGGLEAEIDATLRLCQST
ncbi:MAG: SDR family oxidoreductase [bacterium]